MIQIFALRSFYNVEKKKNDVNQVHMGSCKNMEDIFNGNAIKDIPESERYNLYYTIAHSKVQRREFIKQEYYLIDIDPEKDKDGKVKEPIDFSRTSEYIKCLPPGGYYISSGNGIQALYKLREPLTKREDFKKLNDNNKIFCDHINSRLKEKGLPGQFDTSVFKPGGLARIPNTENRKPINDPFGESAKVKKSSLLRNIGELDAFDIHLVFKCSFLQESYENAKTLSEQMWYTAIDAMGMVDREVVHRFSSPYHGYVREETDAKIDQARDATSGPRTCEDINGRWGGCKKCPFFQKCHTPAQLMGLDGAGKEPSFGGSVDNGFTILTEKGKPRRDYEALWNYFNEQTHYINFEDRDVVYRYTGTHFVPMSKKFVINFAEKHFKAPTTAYERNEFFNKVMANNLKNIEDMKQNDGGYVNCKNGLVDMRTGELLAHSPEWFLDHCLDYDYDPDAKSKYWHELTKNLMRGRQHLMDTLDEFGGYCLSNDPYNFQKLLMMSGAGNNGKTTLANCYRMIFGTSNCSDIEITSLSSNRFAAAGLEGKLVNFCEEEPKSAFSKTGPIKKLTGNTPLSVERKGVDGYSIRNRAKLIMSYNVPPYLGDTSEGMQRRLLIIPFDADLQLMPELKIKDIYAKIREERSGILNIFIAAYQRLLERGDFLELAESRALIHQMVEESDSVFSFVNEHIVTTCDEEHTVPISVCWDLYKENYETKTDKMAQKAFYAQLKKYLVKVEGVEYKTIRFKTEKESKPMKGFVGVQIMLEDTYIAPMRKH